MPQKHSSVLAVVAHPDDEVLCGAGTLALCAARGARVTLVCLTRGELGPIADERLASRETLADVRAAELRASCSALGIADLRLLDLPDAGIAWAAAERGTLAQLVQIIRMLQPAVLITFGSDGLYGHSDHVAVSELMLEARRAAADSSYAASPLVAAQDAFWIPRVFYPVITSDYVADLLAQLSTAGHAARLWSLKPSDFRVSAAEITSSVDVSPVLERKLQALHSHRTQLESDNALGLLSGELARRFLSTEHFRCADGLPGDPVIG
jgi:LmbE family N-acetylglucosaminyl deacetylase